MDGVILENRLNESLNKSDKAIQTRTSKKPRKRRRARPFIVLFLFMMILVAGSSVMVWLYMQREALTQTNDKLLVDKHTLLRRLDIAQQGVETLTDKTEKFEAQNKTLAAQNETLTNQNKMLATQNEELANKTEILTEQLDKAGRVYRQRILYQTDFV